MTVTEYNKTVDQYADALYRFLAKAGNNTDQAKDWVQESFIVLWNNLLHVDFTTAKKYLFTVGYRKMIDHFRTEKRQYNISILSDNSTDYVEPDNTADLQEVLDAALKTIPEIQRTVVIMRDYEGYNYQEIGEITGLNESQVKVYIFRARSALKNFLMNNHKIYPNYTR